MIPNNIKDKVIVDVNGCWLHGFEPSHTYGRLRVGGKRVLVHRYTYSLVNKLSGTDYLDHFRLNPGPRSAPCSKRCCNPAHLEIVTREENTSRAISGQYHFNSKLNPDIILKIRERHTLEKVSQTKLAEIYGVNQSVISRILNKKAWTCV